MAINRYWDNEKGKYVDQLRTGAPRGNNATKARFVLMLRAVNNHLNRVRRAEENARTRLKKAHSSKSTRARHTWNGSRFVLVKSARSRIPALSEEVAKLRAIRRDLEAKAQKIKVALAGEKIADAEKIYLTILQSNDIRNIERTEKRRAKKEGRFYNAGWTVKDSDIY